MNPLTVVLPADGLPGSFDFLWQLQNMLATSVLSGHDRTNVYFEFDSYSPGVGQGHAGFLDRVIRPLMGMFGVNEVEEVKGDAVLGMAWNSSGTATFYDVYGMKPFPWKANEEAQEWAEDYRGWVTITLRECSHYPLRNSNPLEWMEAADVIKSRGDRVVFVPDTEMLWEEISGFECATEAALDIHKRAALYEVAKANLSIANGPIAFCICMPHIPYLLITTKAAVKQFETENEIAWYVSFNKKPPSGSKWKIWLGVDKGEVGPIYRGPQQLWLWDEDNRDVILRGYDAIMGAA